MEVYNDPHSIYWWITLAKKKDQFIVTKSIKINEIIDQQSIANIAMAYSTWQSA